LEQLHGGYTLKLCEGAFPLSTDSMLLSGFVSLPRQARVLDLGSGCGTLGLLLCASDPHCRLTGVELDENAHHTALENISDNALHPRLESICADIRAISQLFPPGSFSCCVSNPPYFSGGAASQSLPLARQELSCTPDDLFACGSRLLKFGGDFFLVHKPERLAQLITTAAKYDLEAKRLRLVRHREGAPVNLILLQLRKGAKPGLVWEEIILHHADGSPTPTYQKIYHF